ncbi:MAG TPA: hypothetical protein VLH84_05070 [Patescibacteria group bacterium]|nr:hypothetical protein [Patescibacteria group bacterium]
MPRICHRRVLFGEAIRQLRSGKTVDCPYMSLGFEKCESDVKSEGVVDPASKQIAVGFNGPCLQAALNCVITYESAPGTN